MKQILNDYPVVLEQQVRWGDEDSFQHVNNTVYFKYFEDARIAYFDKIDAMVNMGETKIGPILANARTDFRAALTYPDTISIGCRISDVHEKKFTMQYVVYSHKMDCIAAEGDGLIVFLDYAKRKSCAIPAAVVAKIKQLEQTAGQ
ncbi:MAG: acyl-CoA thioesterase [Gammaproteobacteria bacterium]|nr:acyl-CoA thioesterase [Gammaproteobacteria bacterium]NNC96794.1 acyl-CoA thioesterase [Gammaproteobacteria bacterium]NNM13406.1 acyl-CoA thioesterase [Gammaproteobacteria bacterium]